MRKYYLLILCILASSLAYSLESAIVVYPYVRENGVAMTGTHDETLSIYYDFTGGDIKLQQNYTLMINNGYVTLYLYNYTALNVSQNWYAEVSINGTALSPRINITSQPTNASDILNPPWHIGAEIDTINSTEDAQDAIGSGTIDGITYSDIGNTFSFNTTYGTLYYLELGDEPNLNVNSSVYMNASGVLNPPWLLTTTYYAMKEDYLNLTKGGTINNNIIINGNLSVIGDIVNFTVINQLVNGSILSTQNNIFDIGSHDNPWNEVYATTFNGDIAWNNVSGKPTALSGFTNDLAYYNSIENITTFINASCDARDTDSFNKTADFIAAVTAGKVCQGDGTRANCNITVTDMNINSSVYAYTAYDVSCTNCLSNTEVASADTATTAANLDAGTYNYQATIIVNANSSNNLAAGTYNYQTLQILNANSSNTANNALDVTCTNCLSNTEVASSDTATTAANLDAGTYNYQATIIVNANSSNTANTALALSAATYNYASGTIVNANSSNTANALRAGTYNYQATTVVNANSSNAANAVNQLSTNLTTISNIVVGNTTFGSTWKIWTNSTGSLRLEQG